MIRTRDFFLFVSIVVFLLLSIGATLVDTYDSGPTTASEGPLFADGDVSIEVITPDGIDAEREQRILSLRQKIAASADLVLSEGEADELPEQTEALSTPQLCPGYGPFTGTLSGVSSLEVVEGARVLYQEIPDSAGTSTATTTERRQIAVLPITPMVSPAPNCLQSDVVGITLGGELITNNSARYANTPESVLVGYALDGYPIFGVSEATRDQCGGVVESGLYRYQIDVTSDTILNCFNAVPARL